MMKSAILLSLMLPYLLLTGGSAVAEESTVPTRLEPVMLFVSFSETDVREGRRYSSSEGPMPGLAVVNGGTVSYSRQEVTAHRVRTWYADVEARNDYKAIRVSPKFSDQRIVIDVIRGELERSVESEISTQVSGELDQWIPVVGYQQFAGRKFSAGNDEKPLFVKVSLL